MSLIESLYIRNNIGIDIGDGLTIPILLNRSIPTINTIMFSISEVNTSYLFKIYIGNNTLSQDNVFLTNINIISPEKTIYIEFSINNLLYYNNTLLVIISTKKDILNRYIINTNVYLNISIDAINRVVDIDNYKLKFELINCVELIKLKITKKEIILDDSTHNIFIRKIENLYTIIGTLSNQKLLDIKTNLKNKFFLN